jgi:transposase
MDLIGLDFDALYILADDFFKIFEPIWRKHLLGRTGRRRIRHPQLSISEIMTVLIAFQVSHFRDFKSFYFALRQYHRSEFPTLPSYNRFVELIPRALVPLTALVLAMRGPCTGTSFVDSTVIRVCHIKRAGRNKVFAGLAAKSKSTMGWFFGFKLHLICNEQGDLLGFRLTRGNVDDRTPVKEGFFDGLFGRVFADKGYIGKDLFDWLLSKGVKLVTGIRENMRNSLIALEEKILLRKRSISETINDWLKNVCQIEHSRHRSPANFVVHLVAGLVAYSLQPKKPSVRFTHDATLSTFCA